MTLLTLENVSKRYGEHPERAVLRDVSLRLDAGELAVVWGLRRSGRSTLMRIAAGIEPPDAGLVCFEGHDLSRHGERLLGRGLGYCHKTLRFGDGQTVLDHAMVGPLSRWLSAPEARTRALDALERAGVEHCARMTQRELSGAEAVRVAIARTLTLAPRLIVIDEPAKGVDLADRDAILALLRSLADDGIAVLACTGESTGLSQADRAMVLGGGELRGAEAVELAPVVPLQRLAQQTR